ncbi:MAG: LacI family DNA-binding transcriptional regulator [Caldilinea sp.]
MSAQNKRPRLADVARFAGVSPATVSLVINNRVTGNVRIPAETQQRVLDAAAELGYVADPVAQSLAKGRNGLLGVFTFEAIFPVTQRDFYYPFLVGIERAAETFGFDLLLFTSTSVGDGRRRIYRNGRNRLRLADGTILLGTEDSKFELQALIDEAYPFVFIGRRELPGSEISYTAADYASATAELIGRMAAAGHRRIAYVGVEQYTESLLDRRRGYRSGLTANALQIDERLICLCSAQQIEIAALQALLELDVTALVMETGPVVYSLLHTCSELGIQVPTDLSLGLLGDPSGDMDGTSYISGFSIPREEMGTQAVHLLTRLLDEKTSAGLQQVALACTPVAGSTIAPPRIHP